LPFYVSKYEGTQTSSYADLIPEPVQPSKPGHTFGGWYKDAGLTTPWNFATDIVTEDITLYAKWN
jgi:uncharacterized repeat protein (TIGR02543 family)